MCEIECSIGHVFEALVEAEEVAAELIGHVFDALLTVGFALCFDARIFRALVIEARFRVAVTVRRRGGGRRDRRHRRHRIDGRPSRHRRARRRRRRRRRRRCRCAA